ncbi:hypothetical protein D3C87_602720 [compost metagenome]
MEVAFALGMLAVLVKSVLAGSLAYAACLGALHALVCFTIDRLTARASAGCPDPAQGGSRKAILLN